MSETPAPAPANVPIWAKKNPNRKRGRGIKSKAIYTYTLERHIRFDVGLFKDDAIDFVSLFFDEIMAALANTEKVTLEGFGTFHVRQTDVRHTRINPNTSQPTRVNVQRRIIFTPAPALRRSIAYYHTLPKFLLAHPLRYRFPLPAPQVFGSCAWPSPSRSATGYARDWRRALAPSSVGAGS